MKFKCNKIKTAGIAIALSLFTAHASAGILLEPYLGYYMGQTKQGSSSNSTKGLGYGGRVGYENLGFQAGLDYMMGNWTEDVSGGSVTLKPTDIGIFVGYDFPILLRVYGEYILSAKADASSSSVSDTLKGTGFKLGVGYSIIPLVNLNLEYISHTYTEHNGGSLTNNVDQSMYGLSVSIPLTF